MRSAIDDGDVPDIDLRRQARAAGLAGSFPSRKVLMSALRHARGQRSFARCASPDCAVPATRFQWRPADAAPSAKLRGRVKDLHLLCDTHHREAAQDFLDADARFPHTAAATWARIEAAEPLVPRDHADLWTRGLARLLTDWPLANDQTRQDIQDWLAELRSEQAADPIDLEQRWNAALDRLGLPVRRRRRLERGVHALVAYAVTL